MCWHVHAPLTVHDLSHPYEDPGSFVPCQDLFGDFFLIFLQWKTCPRLCFYAAVFLQFHVVARKYAGDRWRFWVSKESLHYILTITMFCVNWFWILTVVWNWVVVWVFSLVEDLKKHNMCGKQLLCVMLYVLFCCTLRKLTFLTRTPPTAYGVAENHHTIWKSWCGIFFRAYHDSTVRQNKVRVQSVAGHTTVGVQPREDSWGIQLSYKDVQTRCIEKNSLFYDICRLKCNTGMLCTSAGKWNMHYDVDIKLGSSVQIIAFKFLLWWLPNTFL